MGELYNSYLINYDTDIIQRCRIVLSNDWRNLSDFIKKTDDEIILYQNFDIDQYNLSSEDHKNKLILTTIHKSMKIIAKVFAWKIKPLKYSFNNCLQNISNS